jgi:hypothetical protein
MHHSSAPRISRSKSLGVGVFVLCDRCFKKAEKDSVYRCDRCGNMEASVAPRKREAAGGTEIWVPLCDHCDWATEWRKRPERVARSGRVMDWAALAAGIALIILPALSLPRLHALVKTYHASSDAQAISTRLYASRLHGEQAFTRARVVIAADQLVPEKFDRTRREWQADGDPVKLSSGIEFGFGQANTPPPGLRALQQSPTVMFNSRGAPVNDNAEIVGDYAIYLTNGSWTYAITITPAGRIVAWRFENGHWQLI